MDKTSLIIGVIFLMGSLYCIFSLVTKPFETAALTGAVVFVLLGLAFIRKSKQ